MKISPSTEMASVPVPGDKLQDFKFDIASGMLESLGLNMYTSIGKSLSEFVANAYDAEASNVWITIPFESIATERTKLRERAKQEVADEKREKFTILEDPLPDNVEIIIRDDGHGMTPKEIQDKYLIINRNRRKDSQQSETGARMVMGRKGLGKLAGFGTAERITVRSKRSGVTYATEFTMDYRTIKESEHVNQSKFQARYIEDQPIEDRGTTITLSCLRCDSLKASKETIEETLSLNFSVFGDVFKVHLNETRVEELPSEYEFIFPDSTKRDANGYGVEKVKVSDIFHFDIQYVVRFRARETDNNTPPSTDAKGRQIRRGPLSTGMRGARIYCHGRLAAGPTLLKLPTGMHNFHSQAYMECIVQADEIDRQVMDYIGTNRADLKGDSDVVEALRDSVTELMRLALYEHSKFRDSKVVKLVEDDEFTQGLMHRIDGMPRGTRESTKKVLTALAALQGVKSDLYKSTAPLVMEGINAGEVLTNLLKLEADPKSLTVVAHELFELARVENADVLKLYRGRRSAIGAVQQLIDQARATWKSGSRFENKLHAVLKENPWLLGSEFNRVLTSDKPLGVVAKELSQELAVDDFAPMFKEGDIPNENDRPDLVFVVADSQLPSTVTIVELKTPNYPLRKEHYEQLDAYRFRVEKWLSAKYAGRTIGVRCILVGDLDVDSKVLDVQRLNELAAKQGPRDLIQILPLRVLLENARQTHIDAIEVAQKNEEFFDAELSTARSESLSTSNLTKLVPANDASEEHKALEFGARH